MSNPLSVRRVRVQTIDEEGNPVGEPSFGVMAADDHETDYNDSFESLEELNQEIEKAGCILAVVDSYKFTDADFRKIGTDNFYGKDWTTEGADFLRDAVEHDPDLRR